MYSEYDAIKMSKSPSAIILPVKYSTLTPKERRAVRLQYVKAQEGKCWFCLCSLRGEPDERVVNTKINTSLFPENFFDYPVHLHHSHDTGLTLGAVHNKCNAVLWQYFGQ